MSATSPSAPSISRRSSARTARRGLALSAVLLATGLLAAAPARAATDHADAQTSAAVTRLTVDAGRGWVTAQVHIAAGGAVGFEIDVPAAQDVWGGSPDVPVRELGIHCRFGAGPDLHYTCGDTSGAHGVTPYLPSGGYQITLPVSHTGALPGGLAGTTWVDVLDAQGQVSQSGHDAFPVVDGSHFFTTAEVRDVPLVTDAHTTTSGIATVPVSVTVIPGEQVAAVDVTLPQQGNWSLLGSNTLPQGVWCRVRDTATGATILHCAGRDGKTLPTGRYQLVSTLRFTGFTPDHSAGSVAVTMLGDAAEPVDAFGFLRLPSLV